MTNKTLTWHDLDRCDTADDIAELLWQRGIRGQRANEETCPLAVATGWRVRHHLAWLDVARERKFLTLTPAEREFSERFDQGAYPDLDIDSIEGGEG